MARAYPPDAAAAQQELLSKLQTGRPGPLEVVDEVADARPNAGIIVDLFVNAGRKTLIRQLKASPSGLDSDDQHTIQDIDLFQNVLEAGPRLKVFFLYQTQLPSAGYLPLPISTSGYESLGALHGLPKAHLDILETGIASFYHAHSRLRDDHVECIVMQNNATTVWSWSTSMVYNQASKSTVAIIFGANEAETEFFLRSSQWQSVSAHWISLAAAIQDLHGEVWTMRLKRSHNSLWEVENELKMRLYLDTEEEVDLRTVDLLKAHRSLNSFFVELAMYDQVCQTSLSLNKRLQEYCRDEQSKQDAAPAVINDMLARLQFIQSWYEGIQARSTYITRRVETQLQTVYSMVSQRDSAINLDIAQLSRDDNLATREIAIAAAKDSATMRIIAYVTLAFLPATFVATFFSTSFFDFKPSDAGNRVSWWLWLYFVISVPLTGAVLVLWRFIYKQKEQELLAKIPLRDSKLTAEGVVEKIA